jgi:ATP/maltotriose-dependent transcriptional regulator MalT
VLHAKGELAQAEVRLASAVETAPPSVRGFALSWFGGLRMHQGRTEEASDLVERALTQQQWLGHPFAAHHGFLFCTLALGQRGRVVEAFAVNERARGVAVAAGDAGSRFVPGVDNVRSWILRGVGRYDEADDLNRGVLEYAVEGALATSEQRHAGLLDLVETPLQNGDLDAAAAALSAANGVETLHGTMAWHHRQRYWVQQARFAVATGDFDRARELASRARGDADDRGSLRYGLLARVVEAQALAAVGEPFDRDAIDDALRGLEMCGALECWWVTAETAAATGVDEWWRDAERRAGALVAGAGEHAETLRKWIGVRLGALRPGR